MGGFKSQQGRLASKRRQSPCSRLASDATAIQVTVGLESKARQPHAIQLSYRSRAHLAAMCFSIMLTPPRLRTGIVVASVPATKLPAQLEPPTLTRKLPSTRRHRCGRKLAWTTVSVRVRPTTSPANTYVRVTQ